MKKWIGLRALVVGGCGGDAPDVSGTYGLATSNEFNGCSLPGCAVDGRTTPASLVITQSGGTLTGAMSEVCLMPVLGANVFAASRWRRCLALAGRHHGVHAGQCSYVVKPAINGTAHDRAFTGIAYYQTLTNGSPDCDLIQNCMTGQNLDGTEAD